MSHNNPSLEAEYLIALLDAALRFDKSTTISLLRDSALKFKTKEMQKFFHGYRPNKMPENKLIERFQNLAQNPQQSHFAHQLMESSVFRQFYAPSVRLFESVQASDFASLEELRVKRSLALVSIQSGWSVNLFKKILGFLPKTLEEFPDLEALCASHAPDSLTEIQLNFLSHLVKNAVVAWRGNFSYGFEQLFERNAHGATPAPYSDDEKIQNAVLLKDRAGIATMLLDILSYDDWREYYSLELPLNLILLGIDLDNQLYASQGIENLVKAVPENRSKDVSDLRIFTTLALGYASTGDYKHALSWTDRIARDHKTDPDISGFVGSLLACSGRPEEAAIMFFTSLRHRNSPCSWPLNALSELGYLSTQVHESAFGDGKIEADINADIGKKIVKQFLREHPSWESGPKGISSSESDVKAKKNSLILTTEMKTEEQVGVAYSYESELAVLVNYHARVIKLESNLKTAQDRRDWSLVKDIAMELDQTWKIVAREIQALEATFRSPAVPSSMVNGALQNERKDPEYLNQVILIFDDSIKENKKKEHELFESEKQKFVSRLRENRLEHHWPGVELSMAEFDALREAVRPQLLKLETIRNIESGALNATAFASNTPDVDVRVAILDEFLSRLTLGNIGLTDSVARFILSYPWDGRYALRVLDASMTAIKGSHTDSPVEASLMVGAVIPVLFRLSEIVGHDALEYLLSDPILAKSFVVTLQEDSSELALDLVRKMVPPNKSEFVEKLLRIADKLNDDHYIQQFFVYWLKTDPSIEPNAKVKVLSRWLHTVMADATREDLGKELPIFVQLRDALVEDGRIGEATLLVSTLWRAVSDDKIFEGFERPFYRVLIDLLARGGESRNLAYSILENPDWLMKYEYGVELFLYLCHLGDFPDLVEQAQYRYFSTFERAKKRCPVLVNEFFLNARFVENPAMENLDTISNADVMQALQNIKELEHDLNRSSCYNSWVTASEYQTFFNSRIEKLKNKVMYEAFQESEQLSNELKFIDPSEWIKDADNHFHNRAKHPACELMEKYIQNQIRRLSSIWSVRVRTYQDNLIAYLDTKRQPIRQRLLEERRRLSHVPADVSQVYDSIVETVI